MNQSDATLYCSDNPNLEWIHISTVTNGYTDNGIVMSPVVGGQGQMTEYVYSSGEVSIQATHDAGYRFVKWEKAVAHPPM